MNSRDPEVVFEQENGERIIVRWTFGTEQDAAREIWEKRCAGEIRDDQVRCLVGCIDAISSESSLPLRKRYSLLGVACILKQYRIVEEYHG